MKDYVDDCLIDDFSFDEWIEDFNFESWLIGNIDMLLYLFDVRLLCKIMLFLFGEG